MVCGTIIVIAQTKNRVIIAADSRTETTVNGTVIQGIDDSSCKIAALSGDVVFAAAVFSATVNIAGQLFLRQVLLSPIRRTGVGSAARKAIWY